MGTRAVMIVCRSSEVAQRRFVPTDAAGLAVTRTGRRFFSDPALERVVLERVSNAVADAGLWEELETDWLLLTLRSCPGPSRRTSCSDRSTRGGCCGHAHARRLGLVAGRGRCPRGSGGAHPEPDPGTRRGGARVRPCLPAVSVARGCRDDVKVAPFQVLAGEGRTFLDRDHGWHLAIADRLAAADPDVIRTTGRVLVDVTDETSQAAAVDWWTELTSGGGEGMGGQTDGGHRPRVLGHHAAGDQMSRSQVSPDYLWPRDCLPENLERLRKRSLGRKRGLALREFALGVEAS